MEFSVSELRRQPCLAGSYRNQAKHNRYSIAKTQEGRPLIVIDPSPTWKTSKCILLNVCRYYRGLNILFYLLFFFLFFFGGGLVIVMV